MLVFADSISVLVAVAQFQAAFSVIVFSGFYCCNYDICPSLFSLCLYFLLESCNSRVRFFHTSPFKN